MDSPRVAVIGAGAVGCYFGAMLARAGTPVTLIGRASHVDAIARAGLVFEARGAVEHVAVTATTEIAGVEGADIVFFAVKTVDTEETARSMAPFLGRDCCVLLMQNGVDNAARMSAAIGIEAIPVAVYVAAAMAAPGHVRHSGRGDLVLPERPETRPIAALFERAGVPCRLTGSIERDLWGKMAMNCAYNAISALGRSQYARMVETPRIDRLMQTAIAETVAVARADGVELDEAALVEAARALGITMAGATSSTAQDLARGKRTEIASLNGYIARRGAEAGIPVPVNETLTALVELLEG